MGKSVELRECVDDKGVELAATLRLHLGQRGVGRPPLLRWGVACQRVIGVRDGDNAAGQRDLVATETVRVPRAVPPLVVRDGDLLRAIEQRMLAARRVCSRQSLVCVFI